VKTITVAGYGETAYMNGGGNISVTWFADSAGLGG
jgi:hypothetical protein